MIKVNLALRKTAGGSTSRSTGFSGISKIDLQTFKSMRLDPELLKDLPIRKTVLPLVVGVLASFTLESYKEGELKKLNDQIAVLDGEKPKLQGEANKLKTYEELKKNLEADEFTIRTKIDTIQKLIAGRAIPPKLLVSVAQALPEEVWLAEFQVKESDIFLTGYSMGFNQISDLMKNMGESVYFSDLNLKNTQQVKDPEGVEVANFELTARKR